MPSLKRHGDDIEGSARKKSGASNRTGQACDRCKVRKIRCDARPGGCSPCLQNNTECKTTDRITGRATARGAVEQLENENASLKMCMVELQQQLRDNGLEPKLSTSNVRDYMPAQSFWPDDEQQQQQQQQGSWGNLSTGDGFMRPPVNHTAERRPSLGSLLPDFRPGCIGYNYLGVSSGNNWLSPIEGTSLALFGMKIDVAEFLPPESDPIASPMSYKTFLSHALGRSNIKAPPDFPGYEEFKQYADWYFKTIQVFVPVLHRPDFMKLLTGVFKGQHRPSTAETVMLHMVIAIMKFVFYSRNRDEHLVSVSLSHYLYATSLIPDLITGHSLPDMQALVLICSQLRNQPRPGAAWMFTNNVFGIAVEIGLHRSANNWQGSASERDPHTIEMRKRIFWTILLLQVSISGKLGRPMPIRLEDFDIEIPEAQPDNMPGETNLSKWQKCSFRAAIQGFKSLKILMQAYSTVYSIRSGPMPFDGSVQRINTQIDNFLAQLPPELSGGPETLEEDRSPAIYLQFYAQHARLVLHHPSLCRSTSPHLMESNLNICLDACKKLLSTARQLKERKCLDATWMQTTDFLAAVFTTLFIHTQRQDEMSSEEMQKLSVDMDSWLDIVHETGRLLGAGSRLRDAVKIIVDASLSNIARHLAAKTASAGLASASASDSPADEDSPRQQGYSHPNGLPNSYGSGNSSNGIAHISQHSDTAVDKRHRQSYASGNNHIYDTESHTQQALPAYTSSSGFNPAVYTGASGAEDMKPNLHQQQQSAVLPAHEILSHQAYLQSFHAHQPQQNGFHSMDASMLQAGPMAWRHFTDNMITNIGAPEYMSHAVDLSAATAGGMSMHLQHHLGEQQPQQQGGWGMLGFQGPQQGPGGGGRG